MDEEQAAVEPRLDTVRRRLDAPPVDATAMQAALTALQALRLEVPGILREVKKRYEPWPPDGEVHLSWQDLLSSARVATPEDLDTLVRRLPSRLESELRPGKTPVIE
jgi:hypothetical protein